LQRKTTKIGIKNKLNGEIEVPTCYGNIDLLTDDQVIEIKSFKNYKHAMGQVLAYSLECPDKDKCIYLFDILDDANIKSIKKLLGMNNLYIVDLLI
jgi:hypothetical protein